MNTWIKLTDEVMQEMEGLHWLSTTYGTVVVGEYTWVQGHNPHRFYIVDNDYCLPEAITHVMKFTPPKHPLEN